MALLAATVLAIHLVWLAFVIFGAIWTRGRPVWTGLHLVALVWGIIVELSPWPCPLTLAETYFEARAGLSAYNGSFTLHYLDAIVYPDLPSWILTIGGVSVCAINLVIYAWRWHSRRSSHSKPK